MTINIIGVGYVGLVTGLGLASKTGMAVHFIEKNPQVLNKLKRGICPIFEPGLEMCLKKCLRNGLVYFHRGFSKTMVNEDSITFLCVGTPSLESGGINLDYVKAATQEFSHFASGSESQHILVVKSTVVPGTTDRLYRDFLENCSNVHIAHNPEFLREGNALSDFSYPDRIIIGTQSPLAWSKLKNLYKFAKRVPVVKTTPAEAELIKYANNLLLAILISYSNGLSLLAGRLGNIDIFRVLELVIEDRRWRVTNSDGLPEIVEYLRAGCGFGGSCFPKDVVAIQHIIRQQDLPVGLISGVMEINQAIKQEVVKRMLREFGNSWLGKKVAVFGLAFKPGTDDIRGSPSLTIIEDLLKEGCYVAIHDFAATLPEHMEENPRVELTRDINRALFQACCCIVVTAWPEYRRLKEDVFVKNMLEANLIDGRGIFRHRKFRHLRYVLMGRQGIST